MGKGVVDNFFDLLFDVVKIQIPNGWRVELCLLGGGGDLSEVYVMNGQIICTVRDWRLHSLEGHDIFSKEGHDGLNTANNNCS